MNRLILLFGFLALGVLACGSTEPRPKLNLYPTVTIIPTQTPRFIVWTQTPNATYTPVVVVVSPTPNSKTLCVSANVAVYLRPSPSSENYPITSIPNGSSVRDLGGRSGDWYFVALGDVQGWVNSEYLNDC